MLDIRKFFKSKKGAVDLSDKIISLAVALLVFFSFVGTIYTQYIDANSTVTEAGHRTWLALIVTFMFLAIMLAVYGYARKGR